MILRDVVARGIARGEISAVFRRWDVCRVRAGSTLRTTVGVLAVDAVDEVDPAALDEDDATAAGFASVPALLASLPRNDRRLFRVRMRWHGPDPRDALADTVVGPADAREITTALARLDARSPRGSWTRTVLETVAAHPARRAGDLADLLGRDRDGFKLDVRKLKNLGLTLSLDVGYRLSPRGASYLAVTASASEPLTSHR